MNGRVLPGRLWELRHTWVLKHTAARAPGAGAGGVHLAGLGPLHVPPIGISLRREARSSAASVAAPRSWRGGGASGSPVGASPPSPLPHPYPHPAVSVLSAAFLWQLLLVSLATTPKPHSLFWHLGKLLCVICRGEGRVGHLALWEAQVCRLTRLRPLASPPHQVTECASWKCDWEVGRIVCTLRLHLSLGCTLG